MWGNEALKKNLIVGLMSFCWLASGIVNCKAQDGGQLKSTDDAETFKLLRRGGNLARWEAPSDSESLDITYAILTSPQSFFAARNCVGMTAVDSMLAASGIASSIFESELATAFAMWEAVAGLRFRKANVTEPAHILIGAQLDPNGWAFADVFYDAVSSKPIKPISQALICLNPSRRWKVGFDGNFKVYDLRYTFLHEIGHAIGLDHPIVPDQIMSIRYEERFRELQPGDAIGATTLYGAPLTRPSPMANLSSGRRQSNHQSPPGN